MPIHLRVRMTLPSRLSSTTVDLRSWAVDLLRALRLSRSIPDILRVLDDARESIDDSMDCDVISWDDATCASVVLDASSMGWAALPSGPFCDTVAHQCAMCCIRVPCIEYCASMAMSKRQFSSNLEAFMRRGKLVSEYLGVSWDLEDIDEEDICEGQKEEIT